MTFLYFKLNLAVKFGGKNHAANKTQTQKKNSIGAYYGKNHLAEITTFLPRSEKPKPLASNYPFKPRIVTPETVPDQLVAASF